MLLGLFLQQISPQKASISVEQLSMNTYMFSDPSPIPQIGRLYPYFRFDGYTDKGVEKLWNMVVLENDFIKVYVCPDIGGKIWGAIEKSTGKEFLYFNHSVKFRDVAMRGAWISGGLEYNFGDIGHIPTCATPVDYRIIENADGSVSCIVGALDLPSRTNWNVEIRLPKDKAYFETKATWFNNTALPVTYYHWMNAAAKADGNLEFLYPGNKRIGHGGELGDWPMDEGREIKFYDKNNFGIYKSYHIINSYSDYFGGYYHNDDFGFGHYASFDDKPGKKIWIWGLSDQGMIWEDLLTDSDGQYVEYQAGKLFNQAANSSTFTPFKHREFSPHDTDEMKEYWFPLKATGGMVAASKYGVLNVKRANGKVKLILSPLQRLNEELVVKSGDKILYKAQVNRSVLELFTDSFSLGDSIQFEVILGSHILHYNSDPVKQHVDRPTEPNSAFDWESAYGFYVQALEFEKQRRYPEALNLYLKSYKKESGFVPTLNRLALAYYRIMKYDEAIAYADLALGVDTYDGLANYIFGLSHIIKGNSAVAKNAFSIASQSVAYRSASYTEIAKIFLREKDYIKTTEYLHKALAFNVSNLSALEMLAIVHRKEMNMEKAKSILNKIEHLDASSHFINSENVFLKIRNSDFFKTQITNELPVETYLELALKYKEYGLDQEAVKILKLAPDNPIVLLWIAYLNDKNANEQVSKALNISSKMVFPYRVETVEMLKYFIQKNDNWKLKYYLSLIYWNKGLIDQAKKLINTCGTEPEIAAFYLSKAKMFSDDKNIVKESLDKALEIDKKDWRVNMARIERFLNIGDFSSASKIAGKFMKKYPNNSRFGMNYAKALMGLKLYDKCIEFLNQFNVLPYEGATEGRIIYHEACVRAAYQELENDKYNNAIVYARKAKKWPKNLGVGKPYDVDERLDNFIMAYSLERLSKSEEALKIFQEISNHHTPSYINESSKLLLQLWSLQKISKDNKGNILLNEALQNENKSIYLKWVEAKYTKNDINSIEDEIAKTNKVIQDYDTKFIDAEYELVLDLIEIIEKNNSNN